MPVSIAPNELPPPAPAQKQPTRFGWRTVLLVLLGVVAALSVPVLLLAGTLAFRITPSSSGSVEPIGSDLPVVAVTVGLEATPVGCAILAEGRNGGQVCIDASGELVALDVVGFDPGSDLTVEGPTGANITMPVDGDGTITVELGGQPVEATFVVTGTLAGGQPAQATFELVNQRS